MIPKALYSNFDYRHNLDQLEGLGLPSDFIETIKTQAQSVACLVHEQNLRQRKEGGWTFSDDVSTLAQIQEDQFNHEASFGEKEAFRNEYAAGSGTAFLVDKQHVLTAAHCVCEPNSSQLNTKLIQAARLVFGFHNAKEKQSDYVFNENQIFKIVVVAHQFFRLPGKNKAFSEWSDWALLKLDREAAYPPLPLSLSEKVGDQIQLYMLGHPNGLPLKFTYNGQVQGNTENDFFECDLNAFEGNSGSFIGALSTRVGVGILCAGSNDYEITKNYQNLGNARIQACRITKLEIRENRVGERLENCQRLNVLRFLVDDHLLGIEGMDQQINAKELIIQSLKACYKNQNTIPRLLHKALPIEEIYTELVLLHRNKDDDKKTEKKAYEERRINSWEDIHAAKEPILLQSLFAKKGGIALNRVLILGRAGIGKSTLCQHIAYKWANGKLWKERYDALFWVPLRKLQNTHSAETLASFIFRVCCQAEGQKLYSKDITNYLEQNKNRILFVLDGLDEVSMEENTLQKEIVDELLEMPHWIITSRPHAAVSVSADSAIENVGFSSKTIELYIEKSFPTNAQAVLQKIRQNPIIFGLCHIPINLELVCSILEKSKGDISSITSMTGLYEKLTLTLQRRFLEKIGQANAWDLLQGDLEQNPHTSKIFKLLESIAWTGMEQKQLFFSFDTGQMNKIYSLYPPDQTRTELFTQTCTTGFLQSNGDNEEFLENEYSFLHLTFQEYFAARYLVRLMENNLDAAKKCIRKVKFDPRYKIVMWFVAGLLKNEGGDYEKLNAFFEIMDSPKDNVGLYSTLLKVRCLEECGSPNGLNKLQEYEKEIEFWCNKLTLEPSLNSQFIHLIDTFEASPNAAKRFLIPQLQISLANDNPKIRLAAAKGFSKIGSADPGVVLPLLKVALKDDTRDVRYYLLKTLDQISQTDPKAAFPMLEELLKDDNVEIKQVAVITLVQIRFTHSQLVFPLLEEALKDKNREVKFTAVEALVQIGKTEPQLATPLLEEALKDVEVEQKAIKALAEIGPIDPQLILPFLAEDLKRRRYISFYNAEEALIKLSKTYRQHILSFLTKALTDDNKDFSVYAASILIKINPPDLQFVFSLFATILNDGFSSVSEEILYDLGKIGQAAPQITIPLLAIALKSSNCSLQDFAIKILGKIGQSHLQLVLPLLTEALNLKAKYSHCKLSAAIALIQINPTDLQFVPSVFADILKNCSSFMAREDAIEALGQLGQTSPQLVIPLLTEALHDKVELVQLKAAQTLLQINQANPQLTLPYLTSALQSQYDCIRIEALEALGQLGKTAPQIVIPLLIYAFKHGGEYTKSAVGRAVGMIGQTHPLLILPFLSKILNNADESVRLEGAYIVNMLDKTDPQIILPLLAKASKDNDKTFREYAIKLFKKYDLSTYLKSNPNLLHEYYEITNETNLLNATPLSALITCYKDDLKQSVYLSAFVLKCIEENISIFREDKDICFYERGKLCKVNISKAKKTLLQIENLTQHYPEFILESQQATDDPQCLIQ
ncbi:MAG: HEAT repeat domain-containing protein [Parachlamydiaceae bacterium]|nr:HEAT repeat domain-containing protein [Parachlamydiaceae bacterium]